ncbi:serine/threonine-protein kinase [Streptomyces sp. NPDC001348]
MSEDGERTPDGRVPDERLLVGRYRLLERIGPAGTGTAPATVWRALDESTQRYVAVKRPLPPGDPDDEAHRRTAHRLHREARAAARVEHPAAIRIHDVVFEDGLPWIIMEFVPGESLRTLLTRGPLPAPEAARVGLAVLGALRAAHSVGIVHRDVRPANVLLESGTGRVVLTDFGTGHVHGGADSPGDTGFVAPERGAEPGAGPASDLWSLGALLHAAVKEGPGEHASGLRTLITRLLAPEPADRPEAEEAAAALAAIAEGGEGGEGSEGSEGGGNTRPALTATPTTP